VVLAENIKRLRKEKGFTQEKLADSLGVTVGAAYKWENGKSVPELDILVRMAELFQVSLDVLVGYEVSVGGAKEAEKRIYTLQCDKKYESAAKQAETALLRYPNNFSVVFRAGELYEVAGIEEKNEKYLYRSIELLDKSVSLLAQNRDPDISEASIRNSQAQCYMALGKKDKGLEILKKHNVCGVNDSLIALACIEKENFDSAEVEAYIVKALSGIINNALRTMKACGDYYEKKGDPSAAADAYLWLAHTFENLKIQKDTVCYLDRIIAPCYVSCAELSAKAGIWEAVPSYLRIAYELASAFDNTPTHKLDNVKFLSVSSKATTAYDDLGESVMKIVENILTQASAPAEVYEMWQEIKGERT